MCKLLLAHLPANPGLAFVLVQHLDPTHDCNPTEILARTGAIPIRQAAISRGCVDLVLPPEAIAAELAKLGHHRYIAEDQVALSLGDSAEGQFATILALVRDATGIDFALYHENWVRLRIMHRLALRNLDSLSEYHARLEYDPRELSALHLDLLMGITGSFRDAESFERLKCLVLPRILEGRPSDAPIRVWVPGCATGEEAYSIAITLSEYLDETGVCLPVQIFASDISGQAIGRARRGWYPENIAGDVSAERFNRYFTRIDGGYQIDKALREMCVFSRHNVFADPPFSKLDLVSCRNVPIYAACEQNLIPMFHYVLKPNGFLLLGGSETAAFRDLFSLVDREHRIYARRETARKPFTVRTGSAAAGAGAEPPRKVGHAGDVRLEVDRILLSRYSPAGVVVDEDLEVLEILGKADAILSLPAGEVSFNLLRLIPETSLFLEVERLVREARSTGRSARRELIPLEGGARAGEVAVEVVPLRAGRKNTLLILFEAAPAAAGADAGASSSPHAGPVDSKDRQIARLKQELADARERFTAAIEETPISRQESQSTAEDALSANEQLHSLNEELETANEELRSTNEILVALNQELQSNNAALTAGRDFAMSVIETVAAPLLILDTDLRITAANPSFYDTFQVPRSEVEGQLLYSVSGGCWDIPRLRIMLENVLPDHKAIRNFEIERSFPVIGHRVLVLNARQLGGLQQILLGIEDITERQARAEAILHESELRFGNMADAAPVMIWVSGPDMACTFFNKGWLTFTGRSMQQEIGDGWAEGVHPEDLDRCMAMYSSSFQARRSFQMEYRLRRADGEYRWLLDYGIPRFETGGTFAGYVGSCTDITDLKRPRKKISPNRSWRAWERWPAALRTTSTTFWVECWPTRTWHWRSWPLVLVRSPSWTEFAPWQFAAPKSCGS